MNSLMLAVAAASLSLDVGWQPVPEGGVEYIIQIEPQLLESLKRQDVWSDVPPGLDIRRYRITVGNETLPRQQPPPSEPPRSEPPPIAAAPPNAATISPSDEKPASPVEAPKENTFDEPPDRYPPSDEAGSAPKIEPAPSEKSRFDQAGALPDEADAPRKLEPQPDSDPLGGRATSYNEPGETREAKKPLGQVAQQSISSEAGTETEPPPWLPLVFTALALFLSLSANVYLVWIAWGARHRYRALLDRFRGMPSPA